MQLIPPLMEPAVSDQLLENRRTGKCHATWLYNYHVNLFIYSYLYSLDHL